MTSQPTLNLGDSGDAVERLQRKLNDLGVEGTPLATDGQFTEATENVVKAFQQAHSLRDDGVVGERTWGALATPRLTLSDVRVESDGDNGDWISFTMRNEGDGASLAFEAFCSSIHSQTMVWHETVALDALPAGQAYSSTVRLGADLGDGQHDVWVTLRPPPSAGGDAYDYKCVTTTVTNHRFQPATAAA